MKLASVTTSQLEYLIATTTTTSWKEAADAVGVSQPALSQGIAELERRLGLRLFDKQGRKRVPTTEAQHAVAHATRIIAELRELTRWAEQVRSGGIGQISIGMIDTAAIHHFGDTLVTYRRDHPELTVRLQVQPSTTLLGELRAGEVDAIVCVDPDPDDRLVLEPLIAEPLMVYAPQGVKPGAPATWGPWVGFPEASRSRGLIAAAMRSRGANYEIVAESSQPAVLKEMVRLGMGWAVLAPVDAESEPHALTRAFDAPIAERTLTLVRRADREPTPALTLLLDRLRTNA